MNRAPGLPFTTLKPAFFLGLIKKRSSLILFLITLLIVVVFGSYQVVAAMTTDPVGKLPNGDALLPTGQVITPTAAPGSTFLPLSTGLRADDNSDASNAISTALSPDNKTLLVLTSGYNGGLRTEAGKDISFPVLDPKTGLASSETTTKTEWVFVFDISSGSPVKSQQISLPNTYSGLTWTADGKSFYVSGGIDDRIYAYRFDGSKYVPDAPFILLGHNSNQTAPFPDYDGGLLKGTPADLIKTGAVVAGVAVSRDGKTLVAANFENDSVSIVDTTTRKVLQDIKFFVPGGSVATGEYPFDVAIKSNANGAAERAYVSSQRDDEVLAVNLSNQAVTRIPVGSQPNKMLLSPDQTLLLVANGNSDSVSVINTSSNQVVRTISLARSGEKYKGSNPNALALSPDGKSLYVTLGGENAIAVVDWQQAKVIGRIPTGWYPSSVSVSGNGRTLYVVNSKGIAGPNPAGGRTTSAGTATNTTFKNEYVLGLQKAGISTIPVPSSASLARLNLRVGLNNGLQNRRPDPLMNFLSTRIKHIVYIIKENRTYDQVLGDLPVGNGDPTLTLFPQPITPNHHKLASEFATLDNFYDSGAISGDGWGWSTFGRTTDYTEKTVHVLYGNGFSGLTYDYEGNNRFLLPALPQSDPNPSQFTVRFSTLLDPSGKSSILPGEKDISAPTGTSNLDPKATGGYLWDTALRAGKTVRAYGVAADLSDFYYVTSGDPFKPDPSNPVYIPISRTPFKDGIKQGAISKTSLKGRTDPYFRGYDQKQTEVDSINEWKRDLEAYIAENGSMPNLMVMAMDHDHFGSFGQAVLGVNTPELQMSDNDYALGYLVDYLSHRPEWKETAIFVLEDDAQNGPDHVDARRSLSFVISPYTKRKSVIATNYNTVNVIRTMEDILGADYLGLNDANAYPMSDVFTPKPDLTPYTAIVPGNLCKAPVDPTLVPACKVASVPKTEPVAILHDQDWWAQATQGFDFRGEDRLDAEAFNRILWSGIKGDKVPYVADRNGLDLRQNREDLLS